MLYVLCALVFVQTSYRVIVAYAKAEGVCGAIPVGPVSTALLRFRVYP